MTRWFVIPMNIKNLIDILRRLNINLIEQVFIENDTKFITFFIEQKGEDYSFLSECKEYSEEQIREMIK